MPKRKDGIIWKLITTILAIGLVYVATLAKLEKIEITDLKNQLNGTNDELHYCKLNENWLGEELSRYIVSEQLCQDKNDTSLKWIYETVGNADRTNSTTINIYYEKELGNCRINPLYDDYVNYRNQWKSLTVFPMELICQ